MRTDDLSAHVESVAGPLREQLLAAEARVAELETALRFYAAPSLWEATDERGIVRGGGWRAKEDSGATARDALKGADLD